MAHFQKPQTSISEQINLWKSRKLNINDLRKASHYLEFIGYYRLSAYAIPFQIAGTSPALHEFKNGTQFEDILDLYNFDRSLLLLVIDAIERIEVAVRTQICNVMCADTQDPFWYTKEQSFLPEYAHMRLLSCIEKQILDEKKRLTRDI